MGICFEAKALALFLKIKVFFRQTQGATAIEYGLIVAAVALAIVLVVFTLGDQIVGLLDDVIGKVAGRTPV